jgi:hypothetical protein
MPENVQAAYRFIDSLARTPQSLDSLFRAIPDIDRLKRLMAFQYAAVHYDAILYDEYRYYATHFDSTYSPAQTYLRGSILKRKGVSKRNELLLNASVILHIRVVHVDSIKARDRYPKHCIEAEILDTIKGAHIHVTQDAPPRIRFPYSAYHSPSYEEAYSDSGEGIIDIYTPAPSQTYRIKYTDLFKPGKQYLVFLEPWECGYDGTFAHYQYVPFPHSGAPGGALEIDENGNVLDADNTFGIGTHVPVSQFIIGVEESIGKLLDP